MIMIQPTNLAQQFQPTTDLSIFKGEAPFCIQIKELLMINWDFEAFLASYQLKLQRDFCWSLAQQQELVWSLFKRRHIPPVVIIKEPQANLNYYEEPWVVIDGKQRLLTFLNFLNNKFHIIF